MIKLKIKTGDIVRVIAGDHKGAGSTCVDREKTKRSCKHGFKTYETKCKSPQGGIKERSCYSNI
jgi:large subunit ribosomal protein L24